MATTTTDPPPAPAGRRPRRMLVTALWALAVLGSAVPWGVAALREDSAAARRTPVEPIQPYVQAPTASGPVLSPDGRRIAFTVYTDDGNYLYVVGADGTGLRRLADDVPLRTPLAFTPDGRRVLYEGSGSSYGSTALRSVGIDGRGARTLGPLDRGDGLVAAATFSRDGTRLAYIRDMNIPCDVETRDDCHVEQEHDLFVMNVDGSGLLRLTRLPGAEEAPVFSPDGRRIAFVARIGDHRDIHVVDAVGGNLRRLTTGYYSPGNLHFSPDGTAIAFTETNFDGPSGRQVEEPRAVGLDGSARTVPGAPPPEAATTADWSRFAYTAGAVNGQDVYVRDAGAAEGRRLTNLAAEPELDPAAGDL